MIGLTEPSGPATFLLTGRGLGQDSRQGEPSCWRPEEEEKGRVGRWQKCRSAALLHPSHKSFSETDVRRPSKVYQEVNCRYIKLLAEAAITHQPEGQKTVRGIFISFSMLEITAHTDKHTQRICRLGSAPTVKKLT